MRLRQVTSLAPRLGITTLFAALSLAAGCQGEEGPGLPGAATGARALALDDVNVPATGVSLLVLDGSADAAKVADAIDAMRGTVFHVFPPRLLVAKVPAGADAALRALGLVAKFDRAVTPADLPRASERESAFVDVFSNRYFPAETPPERRLVLRHAVRAPGETFEGAPPEPMAGPSRALAQSASDDAIEAETHSYVPYASGTIVVSIILPESNGAGEPSTEDWTRPSMLATYQRVQTALEAIARHEPNAKLRFIPHYESAPAPGGLAGTVDHDWEFVKYFDFIGHYEEKERSLKALYAKLLGHPVDSSGNGIHEYVNRLRDQYKADGAFVVYVANSENGSGYIRPWASFNGPNTALSTAHDWTVFEHEFGHIFGAGDEYCPDQCIHPSTTYGYLGIMNANAQYRLGENGGINDGEGEAQPSLMNSNVSDAVNVYTRGAWGWLDSDGDGLIDVRDTSPVTDVTATVEAGGVVRLAGLVTDKPAAGFRTPFSMNRITGLEYRIDATATSSWLLLPLAGDTRGRQAVDASIGALPPGHHTIEVRALNSVRNVESTPRVVAVDVPAGANTNTAPRIRLVPSSTHGSTATTFTLRATTQDLDGGAVSVRFDANGDGAYDGPFGAAATATARFARPGVYRVKAAARDARGATTETTADLVVLDGNAAPIPRIANVPAGYFGAPIATPRLEGSATDTDVGALDLRWLSERIDSARPGLVETPFAREPGVFQPALDTPVGLATHPIDLAAGNEEIANAAVEQVVSLGGGRVALALGEAGVAIVDLTDRAKPRLLGRTTLETYARRLLRKDNTLYVLGGPLTVVDIANPSSPREVKQRAVQAKRRVSEVVPQAPEGIETFVDHQLEWAERIENATIRLEIDHPAPADLSITLNIKRMRDPIVLRAQGTPATPATPGAGGKRVYSWSTQTTPALAALRGRFAYGHFGIVVTDHGSAVSRAVVGSSRLTFDTRFRAAPVMLGASEIVGVVSDQIVLAGLGLQTLDARVPASISPVSRIRGAEVVSAAISGSNVVALAGEDLVKPEVALARETEAEANLGRVEPTKEQGLFAVSLRTPTAPRVTRREPTRVADSMTVIGNRMYFPTGGGSTATTTISDVPSFLDGRAHVLGTAPFYVSRNAFGDARTLYTVTTYGRLEKADVTNARDARIVRAYERPSVDQLLPLSANEVLFFSGTNGKYARLDDVVSTVSALYRMTLEARDASGAIGRDTRTLHVVPYNHAPSLDGVALVAGRTQLDTFRIRLDVTDPDNQPSWDPSLWAGVDVDDDGTVDEWSWANAGAAEISRRFAKPGRYTLGFVVRDGFFALSARKTITIDVAAWQPRACGSVSGACSEPEFCNYEIADACGTAGEGVCVHPESITCKGDTSDPVCGCDHRTYDNECHALLNGTSVASRGECPAIACGGATGAACPDRMFCLFPPGNACGEGGVAGTCEPNPDFCFPGPRGGTTVCGCDGQTHPSACASYQSGSDMRFYGTCETGPNCLTTGCPSGESCQRCASEFECKADGSSCF